MSLENLEVRMGLDSTGFERGLKAASRGLTGLKNAAGKIGLGKAFSTRQAEKELANLRKQMELNQKQMAKYQAKAAELRLLLSNPPSVDTSAEQTQLDNLVKKLDNVNAQIDERRQKLAQIQAAHTGPQGQPLQMSAKSTAETLKLEKEMIRLEETSDKTAASIAKLEDKISSVRMNNPEVAKAQAELDKTEAAMLRLEKSSTSAAGRVRKIEDSLGNVGEKASRASFGLKGAGRAAKEFGTKATKPINLMSKAINQAIKRVLFLGVAYKLIRGATKYLTDALKTNKQFSQSLNELKVNLATAFQPIYQAILPAINSLMAGLAKVTGYLAAFISMAFGKTYSESKKAASGLQDAKKAMEGYGGSAEEAKGQLASFDKFNDITPQKGGGSGSALDFGAVEEPKGLTKVAELFEGLSKLLKPAKNSMAGLRKELDRLKSFAWKGLTGFYSDFLKPVGSWVFGQGIPRFIDALTNGLAKVNWGNINGALANLWDKLTPFAVNVGEGLLWFWENVLVPFGSWTMNKVVPKFLDLLAGALDAVNAVINAMKPAINFLWENFLKPIAVWTGGKILDILDLLRESFGKLRNWIVDHGAEINETLTGIGEVLSLAWEKLIRPALDGIWTLFKATFGGALDLILAVAPGIIRAIGGITDFLAGVFTGDWERAWEGIKNIFGGVWDSIKAIAKKAVNAIIDGFNWMIRQLNKIRIDIPEEVTKLTGMKSFGFKINELKHFAKGGLAYGEVQAVVGDNFNARQNPEVVSPLSDLQDMITAAVLQRDIAGGGSNEILLKMVMEDGTALVEALIDPMNKTAKNLGYAPVFKPA